MYDKLLREMVRKESRGWGVVATWMAGAAKWTDYNIERMTDEGYRKNAIASACVSMIATSAPEAPLKVYREANIGLVEVADHWLPRVLKQPNPHMSAFELWEWVHTFLNTGGASYWELVRASNYPTAEVLEIYPLRPDRIRIVPDANRFISHYEYHVNGIVVEYEPWEILQVKFPDPLDEYYGLSPMKRIVRELGIDNEATDFTANFFANAAVPYGLLTSDQPVQQEEAERIRMRWWNWFRGRNRGKPAVLGQGTKYQQLGLNFKDMEFESLRSMTETRICAAFGVDPVLLPSWVGIKHGGKYSNYSEARQHLWEETIIPALRRIDSKITSQFLASEGLVARFDISEITALREDENEKHTRVQADYVAGIITLNEARLELGYDPIEGGDEIAKPAGNGDQSPNNPDDDPNNPNTEDLEIPDDAQQDDAKSVKKKIVITEEKAINFGRRMTNLYDRHMNSFVSELKGYFNEAKRDVIGLTSDRKSSDRADPLYLQKLEREIYALILKWQIGLADISTRQIRKILEEGGSIAAALVNGTFNGTSPEVIHFLESYVPKFVMEANKNTREDLKAVLVKAQVEGWGVPKLRDELRHVFNGYNDHRVERIARSEIVRSSNAGARIAYKQSGIIEMQWLDTEDKRTCPFCRALDGTIVGIEQVFVKLGDTVTATGESGQTVSYKVTYEPVQTPPLHPHCRCTITPVTS